MADKPLRPCAHPGCVVLVPSGYCDKHKRPKAERRESAQWHSLYTLPEWTKRLRPNQLAKEPYCRECWTKRKERTAATVVDHIIPHRGRIELFLDADNLQSLCKSCHDQKTCNEMHGRKRKA